VHSETGRAGDTETGRRGERETRRRGETETRRRGDAESGRHGDAETGRAGDTETGRRGETETRGSLAWRAYAMQGAGTGTTLVRRLLRGWSDTGRGGATGCRAWRRARGNRLGTSLLAPTTCRGAAQPPCRARNSLARSISSPGGLAVLQTLVRRQCHGYFDKLHQQALHSISLTASNSGVAATQLCL
jgi:hypothetical protein